MKIGDVLKRKGSGVVTMRPRLHHRHSGPPHAPRLNPRDPPSALFESLLPKSNRPAGRDVRGVQIRIRSPFVLRYPSKVKVGTRLSDLVICQDIAPTVLRAPRS